MTTPALPTTPGYHDITHEFAGLPTQLSLHLPAGPVRGLILVLHYGGAPRGHYGRGLLEQLFVPAWRDTDCAFAAPVTLDSDWRGPHNARMVPALVENLRQHWGLDRASCRLTGYSLGAMGCWHFLNTAPDLFGAVVPIAGPIPEVLADFTTPVRVLHSDADELFPAAQVETRARELAARGNPLHWQVLSGVTHYQVGAYRDAVAGLAPALFPSP